MREVVVGTRGSLLATTQTNLVIAQLKATHPEVQFRIKIIQTEGDRNLETSLPLMGGKGVFIKEIEAALLSNEIDLAVHSLKDMPTEMTPGLELEAILKREDPRDAFISRYGLVLEDLPQGAVIGTGSPRRACQLLSWRGDLVITDIRGNVDTRLRKLDAGEYDGIVLAAAGLKRLGLEERITEHIDPSLMTPAVGQGALAVEIRAGDPEISHLLESIRDLDSQSETTSERAFLHAMGGGCSAPITAFARIHEGMLEISGMAAYPNGSELMRAQLTGPPDNPDNLGIQLATQMLADGADEILKSIHNVN